MPAFYITQFSHALLLGASQDPPPHTHTPQRFLFFAVPFRQWRIEGCGGTERPWQYIFSPYFWGVGNICNVDAGAGG